MIRNARPRRLRDAGAFGTTCQPACSAGGTLCADPGGFLSSLNPCCSSIYTPQPNDGYCGGGATPTVAAITGSTAGCDTCTAGGVACPDPSGFLASLNPCCSVPCASSAAAPPAPNNPTSPLIWLALGIGGALILSEALR
jgi:hypothetical protein